MKINQLVHYRPPDEACRSAIFTQAGDPVALHVLPAWNGIDAQMVRPANGEHPTMPDAWHLAADCPDGV